MSKKSLDKALSSPNTKLRCPTCRKNLWRVMWGEQAGQLICRIEFGGCGFVAK